MARFTQADRQRIIDGYLNETGANQFEPGAFIDWLADKPDHEAHPWFFGQGDEVAAREFRIGMARQMANGLRITAQVSSAPAKSAPVSIAVREYPAMISPVAGRKQGGGYEQFDPQSPVLVAELRSQGAQALRAWLARYRGIAEQGGLDVRPIEEIAAHLTGSVVAAA